MTFFTLCSPVRRKAIRRGVFGAARLWLVVPAVLSFSFSAPAHAQVRSWDPNPTTPNAQGGTGTWNTSASNPAWFDPSTGLNSPWASPLLADFAGTAGTVTVESVAATGLRFSTPGYQLTGTASGSINLAGGSLTANASATLAVNLTGPIASLSTAPGATLTNAPPNLAPLVVTGPTSNSGTLLTRNASAVFFQGPYTDVPGAVLTNEEVGPQINPSAGRNTLSTLATRGFHFANGLVNDVYASVRAAPYNSTLPSPVIAVDGASVGGVLRPTTVNFHGTWYGPGQQFSIYNVLSLTSGSRFYVASDAVFDIVLSDTKDQWARQLWVGGDNTGGTLELSPDFVAVRDNTTDLYHQNRQILGAIQMTGGAVVVTHSTQSLPVYRRYLETDLSPDNINGHMSFRNNLGGSPKWRVASNAQTYQGAIWFFVDGEIQTDADLTSTGRDHFTNTPSGGPYRALNGFRSRNPNLTITKTGAATLFLGGDQAYATGTTLAVNQGTVQFNSDPGDPTVALNYSGTTITAFGGSTLNLTVSNNSAAVFNTPLARIASLSIVSGRATLDDPDPLSPDNPVLLITDALQIAAGALDLRNGGIVVRNGNLAQIRSWLAAGQSATPGQFFTPQGGAIFSSYIPAHGGTLAILSTDFDLSGTPFASSLYAPQPGDVLVGYVPFVLVPEPASTGLAAVTLVAAVLPRRRLTFSPPAERSA